MMVRTAATVARALATLEVLFSAAMAFQLELPVMGHVVIVDQSFGVLQR